MNRTLIAAAYPPELEGLNRHCAELMARGRVVARAVGVGLVESSAGIERALDEVKPDRIVLIGTAGALPGSGLKIPEVVVVRRAHLVGREPEYLPGLMRTKVDADGELAMGFAKALGAPLVEAVSTIGITLADAEAERLSSQGPAKIEQLEVFAVLMAAQRHSIPATAVFAIANNVGSVGAAEWRQYHADAENVAVTAIAAALQ